jgi:hypothetical protein
MREKPILFSGEMVRAILAGSKTQTRRLAKLQPHIVDAEPRHAPNTWGFYGGAYPEHGREVRSPYGAPGDRLWVRETWLQLVPEHRSAWRAQLSACERADGIVYRASYQTDYDGEQARRDYGYKWRPSIYMPRWASRISLEITSVRVERLHEISEEDARAEGVVPLQMDNGSFLPRFEGLWDSINGERAPWASNPWVWVVGFKRAAHEEKRHG